MSRWVLTAWVAVLGCASEAIQTPVATPNLERPEWSKDLATCDAGDEAFVRRVLPLLWSRRPASVREVELLVDVIRASDRETLVRGMMDTEAYRFRAQRLLRDLYGARSEATDLCEGEPLFPYAVPDLARHVRDVPPDGGAFGPEWNIADLARSTVLLDDVSPWFMATPALWLATGLVDYDNLEEERAMRMVTADFFEGIFLNRRLACVGCHNSEWSVTGSPDPALDRTWEIPGHFEKALYGASDGRATSDFAIFFRSMGALSEIPIPEGEVGPPWWQHGPGVSWWGWSQGCGRFLPRNEVEPDVLEAEGYLGRPFGSRASVWDLQDALRDGFAKLRVQGRLIAPDTQEVDPNLALAYLTSARFAEQLWDYTNGRRLTVPNGFPRNQAQRDVLEALTQTFVATGFSMKELLVAALMHPWSNLAAPAECDLDPYYLPAVFDPWVKDDQDPARRGNDVGDVVIRWPGWVLMDSAAKALGWPLIPEFSRDNFGTYSDIQAEGLFLREIGVVVTALRGFRDSSFSERLAYEEALGACTDPNEVFKAIDAAATPVEQAPDWIDALLAAADRPHTLEDAVIALKDRLLTDPVLDDPEERALIEALLEAPLDAPLGLTAEAGLRRVCAAFLLSPQFMLVGVPGPDRAGTPGPLVAPGSDRAALCRELAGALFGGTRLTCDGEQLRFVEPAP